jgi:hypothetical protein
MHIPFSIHKAVRIEPYTLISISAEQQPEILNVERFSPVCSKSQCHDAVNLRVYLFIAGDFIKIENIHVSG